MDDNPKLNDIVRDFEEAMNDAIVQFAERQHEAIPMPPLELVGTAIVVGAVRTALMLSIARDGNIPLAKERGTPEFLKKGLEGVANMVINALGDEFNKYTFVLIKQKRETK